MDALGLLPFLIIILLFWLLIIRPARSRQRAQAQLQSELAPGQRVMTTSGLHATVSAVEEDVVVLEAAPGVTMRWAKPAVARILPADGVSADASGAGSLGAGANQNDSTLDGPGQNVHDDEGGDATRRRAE